MKLVNGTVYKWYQDKPILSGISIEIEAGEVYQVVGKDEIQKQTLLEVLAQIETNRLNALDFQISLDEIVYIPRKISYYKTMTVKGLISFYNKTRSNFNKEVAIKYLNICEISEKKLIAIMNINEQRLLSLIIGLSHNVKLYLIDQLYSTNPQINDKIDKVLTFRNNNTYVINDSNKLLKVTKKKNIIDHNNVVIEEAI